jgi:polyisoprenoid-binding protein YceI
MSIQAGTYTFGPAHGQLLVRTQRGGAAARAGHNLTIEVRGWEATLTVGDAPAATLTVDGSSLYVLEGRGGMMELGESDKASIRESIDDEVLKRGTVIFRSTGATASTGAGGATEMRLTGELDLVGATAPIEFDLRLTDGGHLTGKATVTQSRWGMKPFSTLFGTLKVLDEVEVEIDAHLS